MARYKITKTNDLLEKDLHAGNYFNKIAAIYKSAIRAGYTPLEIDTLILELIEHAKDQRKERETDDNNGYGV